MGRVRGLLEVVERWRAPPFLLLLIILRRLFRRCVPAAKTMNSRILASQAILMRSRIVVFENTVEHPWIAAKPVVRVCSWDLRAKLTILL